MYYEGKDVVWVTAISPAQERCLVHSKCSINVSDCASHWTWDRFLSQHLFVFHSHLLGSDLLGGGRDLAQRRCLINAYGMNDE